MNKYEKIINEVKAKFPSFGQEELLEACAVQAYHEGVMDTMDRLQHQLNSLKK